MHALRSTPWPEPEGAAPAPGGEPLIDVHLVAPPLVSWGLQRLLQAAGTPFLVAGVSWNLAEAARCRALFAPHVLVLDLDDGYVVADVQALSAQVHVRLLVLTGQRSPGLCGDLLHAGARGVLHKRRPPGALLDAIVHLAAGGVLAAEDEEPDAPQAAVEEAAQETSAGASAAARTDDAGGLTPRERQVMEAVGGAPGAPLKVVAQRLAISEHTLRNHLGAIYSKLGMAGRLELQAFASSRRAGARSAG